ncbi:MAG: hypothetical protein M1834_004949 [Cirrosporium novae-zelandiae]|nr:MAG: hypothetical protein M1834_004949 [Cirrosporium novae-zelandiae]
MQSTGIKFLLALYESTNDVLKKRVFLILVPDVFVSLLEGSRNPSKKRERYGRDDNPETSPGEGASCSNSDNTTSKNLQCHKYPRNLVGKDACHLLYACKDIMGTSSPAMHLTTTSKMITITHHAPDSILVEKTEKLETRKYKLWKTKIDHAIKDIMDLECMKLKCTAPIDCSISKYAQDTLENLESLKQPS